MSNQIVEKDISYSVATVAPVELFPSVVERVFDHLVSIASNDALYEPGEVRPTQETIEWALRVLLRVIPRYYLRTAEIDVFHGEIHVNWEKGNKRVVAYLASPNILKVYVERIKADGDVEHAMHPNVKPQELSPLLRWLYV
ncbi:MAG: hypothetical protein ABSG51_12835 [Terracidiphilus sp.]|jgi:hypothetical protein